MRLLMIGFVVAVLGGVSMSAANPPWNPGGRSGTPTGVVAVPRGQGVPPQGIGYQDYTPCDPSGPYSAADPFPATSKGDYCDIGGGGNY